MATERNLLLPVLLLFAALASSALASCPQKQAIANLDFERFKGLWNTIREPDLNWPGSDSVTCTHTIMHSSDDGSIRTHYTFYNTTAGHYHTSDGNLRRASPDSTDGNLKLYYGPNNSSADYTVLGTDYDNYAVVWWCRPRRAGQDGNIEVSVVMWRATTVDAAKLTEANALLPEGNYQDTNQDSCPVHDHNHHHAHGDLHGHDRSSQEAHADSSHE